MVTITLTNKEAEELLYIMQREYGREVSNLLCTGLELGELNKNVKVKRLRSIYDKVFCPFESNQ